MIFQVLHMRGKQILRKYRVHSPYKRVVKTARFKQPSYTARTLFKAPILRDATLKELTTTIRNVKCYAK